MFTSPYYEIYFYIKAALERSEQYGEGRSFGGEPEGTKDGVQV
jgi:hypothetical protein